MSTTMVHSSGTLLSASPPWIRPRLIDGRSNSSEDSRENGKVSIRRKTSIAFSTALSPSHGVEPWAARPRTTIRQASTPLAWTPTCSPVGSPVIAKSPTKPWRTISSVERVSMSSDSSSGAHRKRTRTRVSVATSCSAHIIAASAPFMS